MAVAGDLARLAAAHGVAVDYWNQAGCHVEVAPDTVIAVLEALGVACRTTDEIAQALEDADLRSWRRTLPPVLVARAGYPATIAVHVPHGTPARVRVDLEAGGSLDLAQVDRWVEPRAVDGQMVGEATFAVPADLPLGWHEAVAETVAGPETMPLVMTPHRLDLAALGSRSWGFMTQVYSTPSRRSWGIGDVSDLADLAAWSARDLGADFVLVNPLHAASPVAPMAPSPYLPVTRRFANPVYLRIEAIPEFAYLDSLDRIEIDRLAGPLRQRLLAGELIDRDAVWAAKREALELIRRVPLTPGRRAAYDAFVASQGQGLDDFATWCAIVDLHGFDASRWPAGLGSPGSRQVAAFRAEHSDAVDLHRWMQWLLDDQLRTAAAVARDCGMRVGIVHDLAVGVHPEGSDAWALQGILARDVSVGAPPDMYNQMGQDWSQPPWRPQALADAAYAPYRDMLRTVLRHAGGVRIDHVLGLFRLWWIPKGVPAAQGTYVRYDHEALVGILALEAQRAGAIVVGEDLGTVEPWIQDVLRDRGILGTSILWFERWGSGELRRPEQWRSQVLASVTVHDLPPTAGYLEGEHVRIRAELGLLAGPVAQERAAAEREWEEWAAVLVEAGLLKSADAPVDDRVVALHRLLAATPAIMLGVAVPDATGERRAQNQPGTDQEYPNWRVPLGDARGVPVLLDDLPGSALASALARAVLSPDGPARGPAGPGGPRRAAPRPADAGPR